MESNANLPIGAIVRPKHEGRKTSCWVGVVTRAYDEKRPHLCYISFPMRADMKGEMSHAPKLTALELVSDINEYEVIDDPSERRHLYAPELWEHYPSMHTKHPKYLTYQEYLCVLEKQGFYTPRNSAK